MDNNLVELVDYVTEAYDSWFNDGIITSRVSIESYVKNNRGVAVPEEGRIYGEQFKKEFEEWTKQKQIEVAYRIWNVRVRYIDQITKAPSQEAVNAIKRVASISIPKELTTEQKNRHKAVLDVLMTRYGSNYIVYRSIRGIAEKMGLYDYGLHNAMEGVLICDKLAQTVRNTFDSRTFTTSIEKPSKNAFIFCMANLEASIRW